MHLNGVISDHLAKGEKGAVVTVVEKAGSAPRDQGAQMFVASEGRIFGTIGGGSVEAAACREAVEVIRTGRHRIVSVKMDGADVIEEAMICGGKVNIFIEPVDERQKGVYEAVVNAVKRDAKGFVITRYSESGLLKSFLGSDGTVAGDPLDEETIDRVSRTGKRVIASDGMIIVPILVGSPLYIFGAGHVSQHISRIASMIDFDVTVIDDRDDYANHARFPEAKETVVGEFGTVVEDLPFSGREYVVIVTRGHKHDALVLGEVLKRPTRYVGMIGSHRKTMMVFDHLLAKGLDVTHLTRVFAPIGLHIGAETPQEIAVSIAAELIEVRQRPEAIPAISARSTRIAESPKSHSHSTDHHKVLFG
ncbi:MAG: putative xanthine dehydrogenase subunit A [Syntrophorhabdaceae bacterium PtaU1.Bin034]|jgi:xanthine dehydrogenase accessory factor|nr:MAG: putative xanthine dehydrogenase subunit A [Syntrophorhabdaceae bacterium PtaU1.Bin034]